MSLTVHADKKKTVFPFSKISIQTSESRFSIFHSIFFYIYDQAWIPKLYFLWYEQFVTSVLLMVMEIIEKKKKPFPKKFGT